MRRRVVRRVVSLDIMMMVVCEVMGPRKSKGLCWFRQGSRYVGIREFDETKIAFERMGNAGCLFDSEKTAMVQDGMQSQTFDSPGWDFCKKTEKGGR